MGVTKFTIIDSPEKIRPRNKGHWIIIPQVCAEPSMKKDMKTEETSKAKRQYQRHLITNLCACHPG